jgi:ABC-type glycerol-3-phosphate transport system permease component
MMMCSICKENIAVVFVTKIVDGKQTQEGLCLTCAKKSVIQPINQLIEQSGMSEEDIDNLNKQVGNLFDNMEVESLGPVTGKTPESKGNPFFNFINKAFPKNEDNTDFPGEQSKEALEDKDNKNNTRTKTQEKKNARKKKYLDLYGINLTEQAKEDKIDRVIGRQREIDRVIQILNRRTKNNPVLIGEPGVGKTAIAEGLAVRISKKQVPAKLYNSEIYLLDLTGIVAGTQFRGQFESRMKGIIEEAKALGNVILGSMTAYCLGRFDFKLRDSLKLLYIVSAAVPGTTLQVSIYMLFKKMGLTGSMAAPILLYLSTDIVQIWIYLQFIEKISISLDESAMLDGASYLRIFISIIFPLLTPATATVLILKSVAIYNDMFVQYLYMMGEKMQTVSTALQTFAGVSTNLQNTLSAAIIIVMLPTVILFLLMQKKIFGGIVMGSVKE